MGLIKTLSIGGVLYAIPKVLTYCSTKPEEVTTRFDQLRSKMAGFAEVSKEILGEKAWFVLTDVFSENSWISFFAIRYLTRNSQPFGSAAQGVQTISAFFVFCTTAAFVRRGIHLFLSPSQT